MIMYSGELVKKRKNPWIAALLNLFFWGLGYLYNGKRTAFGVMLLIAAFGLTVVSVLPSSSTNTSTSSLTATDYQLESISNFFSLSIFLVPLAFAYDAYKEAEEINQMKGKKK